MVTSFSLKIIVTKENQTMFTEINDKYPKFLTWKKSQRS